MHVDAKIRIAAVKERQTIFVVKPEGTCFIVTISLL
jgi:hypothetical protein